MVKIASPDADDLSFIPCNVASNSVASSGLCGFLSEVATGRVKPTIDFATANAAGKQPEVEVPPRHPRHGR
jgi:hypothetical protein